MDAISEARDMIKKQAQIFRDRSEARDDLVSSSVDPSVIEGCRMAYRQCAEELMDVAESTEKERDVRWETRYRGLKNSKEPQTD
jgi:hypothetical protein